MQKFPEQGKGPADNLATAFCSVAEFLCEAKILGVSVGILLFFAAVIAAITAYNYFDTFLYAFLLIIVVIAGQFAYFLICKRTGLGGYLLETGIRIAALGVGWLVSYAFLDLNSFLGVLPIIVLPFVGDGVLALYRKWHRKA